MEYTDNNRLTEGKILFNYTFDIAFLSDSMRIASFLKVTKHKIEKYRAVKKQNNL